MHLQDVVLLVKKSWIHTSVGIRIFNDSQFLAVGNIIVHRWSKIAAELRERTDNEIKNYWRTRVQKQARQLKIDCNSKRFLETQKNFWMPRLVEKMDFKFKEQI